MYYVTIINIYGFKEKKTHLGNKITLLIAYKQYLKYLNQNWKLIEKKRKV